MRCGAAINLTLQLNDGAENLGTTTINLNVGAPRFALRENFDGVTAPNLPNGWATSASGAQEIWKTSTNNFRFAAEFRIFARAESNRHQRTHFACVFQINSENAELTFRNRYDLETTFLRNQLYDGGSFGDKNRQISEDSKIFWTRAEFLNRAVTTA